MTTATLHHVRTDQLVYTWTPETWPAGVLTGYVGADGGFVLEHVIAFDRTPTSALALVRAGLEAAWEWGFGHVVFQIPHAHPQGAGLQALARRVGARAYQTTATTAFFVRYRP